MSSALCDVFESQAHPYISHDILYIEWVLAHSHTVHLETSALRCCSKFQLIVPVRPTYFIVLRPVFKMLENEFAGHQLFANAKLSGPMTMLLRTGTDCSLISISSRGYESLPSQVFFCVSRSRSPGRSFPLRHAMVPCEYAFESKCCFVSWANKERAIRTEHTAATFTNLDMFALSA